MRLCANQTERSFVKDIKAYGVAKKTVMSSLQPYKKFEEEFAADIYAGCPDMDVLFNKLGYHAQTFGRKLHPCMAVHGGGSGIHPLSPLNAEIYFPIDYFCHHIILGASEQVKNTKRLCVYDHIGCGAARLAGLHPSQQIELNLLSRGYMEEQLRSRGKEFEVVPLLYVYYGEEETNQRKEETFVLDLDAWLGCRLKWSIHISALPVRLPNLSAA